MSKGLKRICMNCGMRFYDMDKDPIICPSCETEFTGEIKVKTRRGRAAAMEEVATKEAEKAAPEADEEDDLDDIDADDDIVSLDDVEDDEDLDDEDDDTTLPIEDDDLDDDLDDLDDDLDDLDDEDDEKA